MRIVGLGIDQTEIDRVRRLLAKYPDSFRRRCFTDREWEYANRYADPSARLAGRFSGKEAVMKSLGTGWRRLRWTDIEVTGGGPPRVILSGRAAERAKQLGVTEVKISISYEGGTALVQAISVGEDI
jgi:holo-[acyl-carrier protein] synthase